MAKKRQTLGQRIVRALGGVTRDDLARVARESYAEGFNDANDDPASGDLAPGGYGYRPQRAGQRDTDIPFDQSIATAWALNQSNPIAKRGLDLRRDYIIGRGVKPVAVDADLQDLLDAYCRANQMETNAAKFARQLFLFGVQCLPAFVREADGRVLLGYIDPGEIEAVIAHPDNAMLMAAVVVRPTERTQPWEQTYGTRVYRVIRRDAETDKLLLAEQANLEEWEFTMLADHGLTAYSGSCHYFKINDVVNQQFGQSELTAIADWLDQRDEALFALGDREQMASYFSWDVTMTGADESEIKARAHDYAGKPPKPGSVNFHNESEAWSMNFPDIKQTGTIATSDALLEQTWGGLGYPRAWFGTPQGAHLATLQAQGDPTWRSLDYAQGVVEVMLLELFDLARDQAILAGAYIPAPDADTSVSVSMPEMTSKDVGALSSAMATLASALLTAETQGWITKPEAASVFANLMDEFDVDVDLSRLEEDEGGGVAPEPGTLLKDYVQTHPFFTNGEEEPRNVDLAVAVGP
jgi:hypothetical protein